MMRRLLAPFLGLVAICGVAALIVHYLHGRAAPRHAAYAPPQNASITHLPPRGAHPRALRIEAATDISFMRPFLQDFQQLYPDIDVIYADMLSTRLLNRALAACANDGGGPDLYLTVATDNLVRLANDGCGSALRSATIDQLPGWKTWRAEVFVFALEPAVFVYDRSAFTAQSVPHSHLELIESLRSNPARWDGQISTYDIRASGIGYNFAEFDSRQSSIFGRLLESLGRSHVRLFCCSNEMVDAVAHGQLRLAYNVQLSYAYQAQARSNRVGIVIPSDYQAVQTRSVMVARDAVNRETARLFVDYLLSPRAQAIEARLLHSPTSAPSERFTASDRLLSQIDVSAELLRLQDTARRRRLMREWSQALGQPAPKEL